MSCRAAVVGAGWYGCHIALVLKSKGIEVTVFDRNPRPLMAASGNNQFRLHLGFHYARHYPTRRQSLEGFSRFMAGYGELSRPVNRNIYAVPNRTSLIDLPTYKAIMASTGIPFRDYQDTSGLLKAIDGAIVVDERVVMTEKARGHFERELGSSLICGADMPAPVQRDGAVSLDGRMYDYVIDATWGHWAGLPMDVIYEPTLLLYYESADEEFAVTLVDGPLCSVYPTETSGLYTLSSVRHTPLGCFGDAGAAVACLEGITPAQIAEKRHLMERQICENLPSFRERFRFTGPQFAVKTKPVGQFDDRSCHVFREGNIFRVLSGKIDTVFHASDEILTHFNAHQPA